MLRKLIFHIPNELSEINKAMVRKLDFFMSLTQAEPNCLAVKKIIDKNIGPGMTHNSPYIPVPSS